MSTDDATIDAYNEVCDRIGRLYDRMDANRREFNRTGNLELLQESQDMSIEMKGLLEGEHDKLVSQVLKILSR